MTGQPYLTLIKDQRLTCRDPKLLANQIDAR